MAVLHEYSVSWEFLIRIRTGAVYWAPRLAVLGHVRIIYKEKCPGCEILIRESAVHVLMECRAYNVARVKFKELLWKIVGCNIELTMSILLGEQWDGSDPYRKDVLTGLGKYLREIFYIRVRLCELVKA